MILLQTLSFFPFLAALTQANLKAAKKQKPGDFCNQIVMLSSLLESLHRTHKQNEGWEERRKERPTELDNPQSPFGMPVLLFPKSRQAGYRALVPCSSHVCALVHPG